MCIFWVFVRPYWTASLLVIWSIATDLTFKDHYPNFISGRNKFSVIFGLGITKFRTGVVKDPEGNPMWNEETVV